MPLWVQYVMSLAHHAFHRAVSRPSCTGARGLSVVWSSLVWLLAIGAVLFALALARFSQDYLADGLICAHCYWVAIDLVAACACWMSAGAFYIKSTVTGPPRQV